MPHTPPVSDAEIETFLRDVESGTHTLTPLQSPQDVYCGGVEYLASNGRRLVVFNDCNEWDYIEMLVTADGRVARIEGDGVRTLSTYEPSADIAWSRYGIPGYCTFRCTNCGVAIQRTPGDADVYLCESCRQRRDVR